MASGQPGPPPGPPPPRHPTASNGAAPIASSSIIPSSSKVSVSTSTPAKSAIPDDPLEMEKLLSREKMAFFQELEMERVLSAFKLNPYDILECPMEADDKMITKIYRRKSLLIHPDKVKDRKCDAYLTMPNPSDAQTSTARAETAFSLLKQASTHLLDEERRKNLDETVMAARILCLKELGLPSNITADDERLNDVVPSFDERVRKGTKEIMIDDELRKRR
jgi:DnaJ family protein C protein 8